MKKTARLLNALLLGSLLFTSQPGWGQTITIGVLAHRGPDVTLRMWNPLADYLGQQLPHHQFVIQPLGYDQIEPAVARHSIDFLLANPNQFVEMAYTHGLTSIATLEYACGQDKRCQSFGSVIFTRADHPVVHQLSDLRGKHVMGNDKDSLGGFLMAWREFHHQGINPWTDFASMQFSGVMERTVRAVMAGEVDAGIVRTDILEGMISRDKLNAADIRVLNPRQENGFPYLLSTPLYPEWPFARLRSTSTDLSRDVAQALYAMPAGHAAAIAGKFASWTVPVSYEPVHQLYQELEIGPYAVRPTLYNLLNRHWLSALTATSLLAMLLLSLLWRLRSHNRRLRLMDQQQRQQLHELTQAREQLADSEAHYRSLVDSLPGAVYRASADTHRRLNFISQAVTGITGFSPSSFLRSNAPVQLHDLILTEDSDRVQREITRLLQQQGNYTLEYRIHTQDGRVRWILDQGQVNPSTRSPTLEGVLFDITERKLAEEEIAFLAHHDLLTGLPNRSQLQSRFELARQRSNASHQLTGVLFLDLDHFKTVNDTLGHDVGDQLLIQVARTLKQSLRSQDTIVRQGGDEFIILLPDLPHGNDASRIADKVLHSLTEPVMIEGHRIHVSFSIGIALYPEHGDTLDVLMRHADMAMYAAKSSGRNQHHTYHPQLNQTSTAADGE